MSRPPPPQQPLLPHLDRSSTSSARPRKLPPASQMLTAPGTSAVCKSPQYTPPVNCRSCRFLPALFGTTASCSVLLLHPWHCMCASCCRSSVRRQLNYVKWCAKSDRLGLKKRAPCNASLAHTRQSLPLLQSVPEVICGGCAAWTYAGSCWCLSSWSWCRCCWRWSCAAAWTLTATTATLMTRRWVSGF